MLIVISPAKTLDYEAPPVTDKSTQPTLLQHSQQLIDELKCLAPQDISTLMGISDKLGALNYDRFQQWQQPFTSENAKQAVLAFKGDVYASLNAESWSTNDFSTAQQHLRILSGLYGLLRPLDLMQAYRLEMGIKFANSRGKNLYQFWGGIVTEQLNQQLETVNSHTLVNLASNEYFKAVKTSNLNAEIVTPIFKDKKNGQYKIVSFYAKKARGLMSAYIIQQGITDVNDIKGFTSEDYRYDDGLSEGGQWVFTRDDAPSKKV